MLDKLKDRLPGHSRPQRLALLRFAFSEIRLRCALRAIELDDYGKPKPPSSSEQAFNEVGDVLSTTWPACSTTDHCGGGDPAEPARGHHHARRLTSGSTLRAASLDTAASPATSACPLAQARRLFSLLLPSVELFGCRHNICGDGSILMFDKWEVIL